ncbi:ATP-binding protein [Nocardiopsis ansamitocini]|uniref:Serine/threonine protein kinase n=1 Tax=Nocardiopsis ansamitocini TaxID=1670832 RepID=A0A9W6UI33_9ACTN|nr:ATP-binding protein [Nocardiopsis ansamitocini]GLU49516.1 serine/threonine protein kinase [Nocardiopsis ansamitocini]
MSTPVDETVRLRIGSDADLSAVRLQVRAKAQAAGFGLVQQTKLVTAASELARNTLVHGGGGEMEMSEVAQAGVHGIKLAFTDSGPGIADVEQALADGYTSGNGLGMGLGGARRLVHHFDIDTRSQGTTVTIVSWATTPVDPRAVLR